MKIGLCGIYGGLGMRDLNPGCFMLARVTVDALGARIPNSQFHIMAPDVYWRKIGAPPRVEFIDDLEIDFGVTHSTQSLRSALAGIDALVVGGDNLWSITEQSWLGRAEEMARAVFKGGGDTRRSLWLLEGDVLPRAPILPIAFNCVSSRSSFEVIRRHRRRFYRAIDKAAYVAVRDVLLERGLSDYRGRTPVIRVPDPVLGLNPDVVRSANVPSIRRKNGKPVLGVCVGPSFVADFAQAFTKLRDVFDSYHVCFYAYSRMHQNWESHANLKRWINGDISFIHDPLSPAEAFKLTGEFDVVMNDCYHGTIAAIIQGKPVIPIKFFDGERSRRAQLFETLGVPDRSIKIQHRWEPVGHEANLARLEKELPALLKSPVEVPTANLDRVRSEVSHHFDRMAAALTAGQIS